MQLCRTWVSTAQSALCIFKKMCNFRLPRTECISTAVAERAVLKGMIALSNRDLIFEEKRTDGIDL